MGILIKKILFLIAFLLLFTVSVQATTYYVDKDSTGGACSDSNNGTALATPWCSIEKANATLVAGDTVNIRVGSYSVTPYSTCAATNPKTCGIRPVNTGTLGNVITYQPYLAEVVNLVGEAGYVIGIWLNGNAGTAPGGMQYIKVTGTSLGQLNFSNMRVSILLGPRTGFDDPIGDTSYNEISYLYALGRQEYEVQQGNLINKQAFFNHIHHCKFEQYGYLSRVDSGNEGDLFWLGLEEATSDSRRTYYNVIENNEFFHAGHATFELNGDHNVVRNNYFHNDPWYAIDGTDYGYRNIVFAGHTGYTGYNLFEGNRVGHGSENYTFTMITTTGAPSGAGWAVGNVITGVSSGNACTISEVVSTTSYVSWNCTGALTQSEVVQNAAASSATLTSTGYAPKNGNWGGQGIKVSASYNIIRYNDLFNNVSGSISLTKQGDWDYSHYNSVYNNTFYHNGHYDELPDATMQYFPALTMGATYTGAQNNHIKNNLFYDNGNVDVTNVVWGGSWSGNTTYADATNPAKGNNEVSNNFNGGSTWATETNPNFADANAIDVSDPTSATKPTLLLGSASSAIDYDPLGTVKGRLTQVNDGDGCDKDAAVCTALVVDDARYFQDGNFGTGSALAWPASVTIVADTICVGTTTNCAQISAIAYDTNTITLATELSWSDNDSVWLQKLSDGTTTVLYGAGSDAGAHEYDNTGTPPSFTVTVSSSGAGCSYSHTGDYTVTTGSTLNVGVTINNGWQNAWTGTCPATGTTTRICTPTEASTIVGTCTEIKLMPW